MTALDATGLFALEEVAKTLHASKRTLILCDAREQPAQLIHKGEFSEVVGPENICDNVQEALRRAEELYERLEAKFVASKSQAIYCRDHFNPGAASHRTRDGDRMQTLATQRSSTLVI